MVAEDKDMMEDAAVSPFSRGPMGEGPIGEHAGTGFEQYSQTFGNLRKDEGKEFSEQEKERRGRAKKAYRIYKRVCEDVGLKLCFFSNFGDWAEYVDGRMSDAQFRMNTVERAKQMMASEN